jgi:dolichol-phosphate mannosyltransferase
MRLSAALPLAWSLRLHEAVGGLLYRFSSKPRAIVARNLALCFPEMSDTDRTALGRRHFAALAAAFAECAFAWFGSDRALPNHLDIVGQEHLRRALAQGNGVVLYTGHFTGLEICGRLLKGLVPRFACMFSHRSNALLDEIQRRGRKRCAHESISSDDVRAMLASLRGNAVVWYASDQVDTSSNAALIPFFAAPALTSTAASRIARVSGATVIPFAYRRVPKTARYELRFCAPLAEFPTEDPTADTQRLVAMLEEFVRAAPEQYLWTHKRFKGTEIDADPYTAPGSASQGSSRLSESRPQASSQAAPAFSVVIPLNNEASNVQPLLSELRAVLEPFGATELILVDDGSHDDTAAQIRRCAQEHGPLRLLSHADRRGQSTAIYNGIRAANTELVVVLDGDLQNDPADIARFLAAYAADPDRDTLGLLIGQRVQRRDSGLRRLSSRVANSVRARVLHDATPDTGCGLKLVRRSVFMRLPYFDHMHRFLPALVQRAGLRVVSLPVRHRARTMGRAHYGVGDRLWVGLVDLAGVAWLARRSRPQDFQEEIV